MRCPFCSYPDTKVIDSRTRDGARTIRRRRECIKCRRRFTTRETVDNIPLYVIKQNGAREEFNREKLIHSMQMACAKRPISVSAIEEFATKLEFDIRDHGYEEINSRYIGERIMEKLKELDEVAYVRFASVYRNFQAKEEFMKEIKQLE